jgi:hypothetical protein
MQSREHKQAKRLTTGRTPLWTAGTTAMLLSASLFLSACGGTSGPVVEATAAPTTAAAAATATPTAAPATPQATSAATTPEVKNTESMTETKGMTSTEGMTGTAAITGTATITGSEAITGSESMTGTQGITGSEGMSETGAVEGATAPLLGVTGADSHQYVRASTLLDYDFENKDGEVSGDLEDLLIDLASGRVLFASIEYGGVLDLGDTDIVVPLNAFTIGDEGRLVLNIDETTLENYPDVGNDWPDLNDPAWDDEVNAFWNNNGIDIDADFEQPTTSVAWASDLMGYNVADLGSGAGSILDVLVNLGTSHAPYVVVDYGEGLDTDPYIIPLTAFNLSDWSTEFAYGPDFTPDILEQAPRLDQDAYPEGSPFDDDFGDRLEATWNDLGFSNDLNRDGEIDR